MNLIEKQFYRDVTAIRRSVDELTATLKEYIEREQQAPEEAKEPEGENRPPEIKPQHQKYSIIIHAEVPIDRENFYAGEVWEEDLEPAEVVEEYIRRNSLWELLKEWNLIDAPTMSLEVREV